MQYNWVLILSLLWFGLSFTFYCLHKHEKQCQQNLPSWFLFMAAPWWQKLNAVVNSEGCECGYEGQLAYYEDAKVYLSDTYPAAEIPPV